MRISTDAVAPVTESDGVLTALVVSDTLCENWSVLVAAAAALGPVELDFESTEIDVMLKAHPLDGVSESVKYFDESGWDEVPQLVALIDPDPDAALRLDERLNVPAVTPCAVDDAAALDSDPD